MKVFKYLNQYNKKIKSQKTIYLKSHVPVGGVSAQVGLFWPLDTQKTNETISDLAGCLRCVLYKRERDFFLIEVKFRASSQQLGLGSCDYGWG